MSTLPLIWYKFEEASSTQVKNYGSAGSVLDATLNNGAIVSSSDSPVGSTCLNLQNTNAKLSSDPTGQYLSIPAFTVGGSFSFSCWFKKSNSYEKWARIFDFSVSPNGGNALFLAFPVVQGNFTGQVILGRSDIGNKPTNTIDYCDNKWHHIVGVSDSSTLTFYIDNVKINSVPYTALEKTERINNYLGRSSFAIDQYATIQIDDFRFYTTPLDSSEIPALFNDKKRTSILQIIQQIPGTIIGIIVAIILVFIGWYLLIKK